MSNGPVGLNATRRPIGFDAPNARSASVSFTIAMRGVRAPSASVKSRPRRIGSAGAAKYPGVTQFWLG